MLILDIIKNVQVKENQLTIVESIISYVVCNDIVFIVYVWIFSQT